jgi:hypothetical protein
MARCHYQYEVDITRRWLRGDKTSVHYYRVHESTLFQLTDELRESRPQPWSTIAALKDTETLCRFLHRAVVDAFRQAPVFIKRGNHSIRVRSLRVMLRLVQASKSDADPFFPDSGEEDTHPACGKSGTATRAMLSTLPEFASVLRYLSIAVSRQRRRSRANFKRTEIVFDGSGE